MAEIVDFPGKTYHALDPNQVLLEARKLGLKEVVVVGYDQDGEEYLATSCADGAVALWLVETFKHVLLHNARDGEPPLSPGEAS